jgi:hypothetical protein
MVAMSSFDLLRTFTTADLVRLAQGGSWAAGIVLKERRLLPLDSPRRKRHETGLEEVK